MITKEEVEARGSGTREGHDTYDPRRPLLSELRVFFTGIMFLTRLPVPAWVDHHPAYLMRAGEHGLLTALVQPPPSWARHTS